MNVLTVAERLLERWDIGNMGEDPQLDLAVIQRDEGIAILGHEGLADAAAFLGADGDVLQVGVG